MVDGNGGWRMADGGWWNIEILSIKGNKMARGRD